MIGGVVMSPESARWWNRLGNLFGGKEGPAKVGVEVQQALTQVQDADPQIRRSAAWRLGKLGDGSEDVSDALSSLMKDNDQYVRRAATWALKKIESK